MGFIARVLGIERVDRQGAKLTDVKVDPHSGDNLLAEYYSASGVDAPPLPTDYVAGSHVESTGRVVATGYLDPLNEDEANPGEFRVYSRDSEGEIKATVWLHGDGSVEIWNDNGRVTLQENGDLDASVRAVKVETGGGSLTMSPQGDVDINGAKVTASGEVINAAGIILGAHAHLGSPTAPDGPISPTKGPIPL